MRLRSCLALLGILGASVASGQGTRPTYFQGLQDLSFYFKPRFNTPNTWDQQFGLRARIMREGNFSAEYSIAYDPNYPIKFDIYPKWTTGVQFAYFFVKAPIPIGVYTTPKYNLYNQWKQEFGLNFRFLQTERYYLNSSLDYQIVYPYVDSSKPTFQASITLGFPF